MVCTSRFGVVLKLARNCAPSRNGSSADWLSVIASPGISRMVSVSVTGVLAGRTGIAMVRSSA